MDIKLDSHNVRVHDSNNKNSIRSSLQNLGTGRSIVIDADNVIIGGNGVYEQAKDLGLPIKIIESDGRELIAIKRIDLKSDDDKRKALALADNKTSDLSFFDESKVAELIAGMEDFIQSTGFNEKELSALGNLRDVENIDGQDQEQKPEIEFSEELLEEHNYIVLFFDNSVDWLQAKTLFDIKPVKDS
ncbi:MAG: hypothetical protein JXR78_08550, partial [Victivallales bacterium]|nr:hypothetical protein [Victivallales bacterium]